MKSRLLTYSVLRSLIELYELNQVVWQQQDEVKETLRSVDIDIGAGLDSTYLTIEKNTIYWNEQYNSETDTSAYVWTCPISDFNMDKFNELQKLIEEFEEPKW